MDFLRRLYVENNFEVIENPGFSKKDFPSLEKSWNLAVFGVLESP
jgi:hypothetical protein